MTYAANLLRIFAWHVVRDVRRHPLLSALNVMSVALGIAVYVAIQIANSAANRAFAAGVDLVAGKAHLEIRGTVPENLWPLIARTAGVQAATPIVEGLVTLPDYKGEYLRLIGLDVFSGSEFQTWKIESKADGWDLESWLGRPGTIALNADFAHQHGLKPGDDLRALVNGRIESLSIGSLIPTKDSPAAAAQKRFAAMDIGWAQELLGRAGSLSSVQLLLHNPRDAAGVAQVISKILPPNLSAEPPRQRSQRLQSMVSAFQLNLTALSLVSLLVGVFLVYNTISATVLRRRKEIGILRALGTSRWEIRAMFLGEACVFGIAGVAIGSVAGIVLSQSLSGAVEQTISSLYVLVSIQESSARLPHLLMAALLGLGACLLGAWVPAREASRIEPIAALNLSARLESPSGKRPRWVLAALATFLIGFALSSVSMVGGPAWTSFAAALAVLLIAAFLAPGATRLLGNLVAHWSRNRVILRLAADYLVRATGRNSVTVAALASAVAMLTGLTVMIHSFRQTVNAWIARGIVADILIAPASNEIIGLGASLPPEAVRWLRADSRVAAVDTFREDTVLMRRAPGDDAPVLIGVVDGPFRDNVDFRGGDTSQKAERVFKHGEIAVSEPFARKHRVGEGQPIALVSPRGEVRFRIAGVYPDYTRDQGVILMHRGTFDRTWSQPEMQSLGVYMRPGQSTEALEKEFRERFSGAGEFAIYSNRALRKRVLDIFDQTFAVTSVLRAVALIVAITGIFLSVTTLVTEREREIGIFRAVGASIAQLRGLFIGEAVMVGALATGLGLLAGLALAAVLTELVNPAFFGWSITLQMPWVALALTPLWIALAAIAAAWLPAQRGATLIIAETIREE